MESMSLQFLGLKTAISHLWEEKKIEAQNNQTGVFWVFKYHTTKENE